MKILVYFFALFSFVWSSAQEPGKSLEKRNVYLGDPYVLLYNDKYYLYGTNHADGIEVYMSSDLINWTGPCGKQNGLALYKDHVWGEKWFWAPEVYHINNKFYMFFSVEEHIAVAVSDNPLGPFVQDKEEPLLITKAIDTHLFIDDDGTKYLYYVAFTRGNVIWMCEMHDDLMHIKPNTIKECFGTSQPWEMSKKSPIAEVTEGPYMVKLNNVYYLFYSANHFENPDYGMGYATSVSPSGPWKKYEKNPILSAQEGFSGTGHGALFNDKKGKIALIYHAHNSTSSVHPRKVLLNYGSFTKSEKDQTAIFQLDSKIYETHMSGK